MDRPINRNYFTTESFLKDMREGSLRQDFILTNSVWSDLVEMVNTNKEFAQEITDHSVPILICAVEKMEIEGLLVLAEACCG